MHRPLSLKTCRAFARMFSLFFMKNIALVAVSFLFFLAACKKNDAGDPPPTPAATCRLSQVSFGYGGSSDSTVYSFQYTAGALTGISVKQGATTTARTFQRLGNIILVKPGGSAVVDSVFLNADGLIQRHRYRQYIATGAEQITAYEYNGTEVYRRITTYYQNNVATQADTSYFQWSAGNLFREVQQGAVSEYAYDTDRKIPASGGDFFELRTLLQYGAPVVRNTHFVSVVESPVGSGASVLSYEFDKDGKVTKMGFSDGTAGNTGAYTFRYACN